MFELLPMDWTHVIAALVFISGLIQWIWAAKYRREAKLLDGRTQAYKEYIISVGDILDELVQSMAEPRDNIVEMSKKLFRDQRKIYDDFCDKTIKFDTSEERDEYYNNILELALTEYINDIAAQGAIINTSMNESLCRTNNRLAGLRLSASEDVDDIIIRLKIASSKRIGALEYYTKEFFVKSFQKLMGDLEEVTTDLAIRDIILQMLSIADEYKKEVAIIAEELLEAMQTELRHGRKKVYKEK